MKISKLTALKMRQINIIFSLRLLRAYIASVEKQIADSIEDYRNEHANQQVEIDASFDYESGFPDIIVTHRGLESDDWDLDDVFENHFPSLQRRGALITLCAFLENELNDLCNLYQRERKLKVSFKDIRGNGIERAILYLERNCGIGD